MIRLLIENSQRCMTVLILLYFFINLLQFFFPNQTVIGDIESSYTETQVTTLPLDITVDILLMIEVSPELNNHEYDQVVNFLTTFTNAFKVGKNYTR